jgi:hypothetical protein
MPTKIITVNFDRTSESFDDSVLTKFLLNKHVTTLRPEFFVENGKSYWSFFGTYVQFRGSEFHTRNARSRQLQEQRRAKAQR